MKFSKLRVVVVLLASTWFPVLAVAQAGTWLSRAWPDTDFSKLAIELAEIQSGGPPKDGIPAIDQPVFVSVAEAGAWIGKDEPLIALQLGSRARGYPLQILTYHEIVNDSLGDVPVAVTFCPLCNASIIFDRRVNGRLLDFGTTGLLRKSDLVMYDRQTQSWWQQFSGLAIVGELMGAELTTYPATVVSFDSFVRQFPDAEILSRETGYQRPYGRNPYQGYDRIGQRPFLFNDPVDERLPAMERVLNVSVGDIHKVYPFSAIEQNPVINDQVGDVPVLVLGLEQVRSALDKSDIASSRLVMSVAAFDRRLEGRELQFSGEGDYVVDDVSGSRWNRYGEAVDGPRKGDRLKHLGGGSHFAFAWLAFNPDSEIYRN